MFKQFLLSILFSSCMILAYEPISLTGKKTEIAFDIHDVLVKKNIPGMVKRFFSDGGLGLLGKLFASYLQYPFTRSASTTQQFVYDLRQLLKHGARAEEFKALIAKYDPNLWKSGQKMALEMYPVTGIQQLLKELHTLGHVIRPASNIGTDEFILLQKKFPDIFTYLKQGLTVDSITNQKSIPPKPALEFFQEYQRLYNPNQDTIIIFIDDKLANVDAANKAGMIGIRFTSVTHLRKQLKNLGIRIANY